MKLFTTAAALSIADGRGGAAGVEAPKTPAPRK
jgi:hypothetical protein